MLPCAKSALSDLADFGNTLIIILTQILFFMKKIALFLIAAIAVIACKPEEKVTPEVNILTDAATLVIPTEGGQVSVDFEANVDWTAALKETADWCTLTPASGVAGSSSVKLIAVENEGKENRSVTVVITAETAVKEFTVTQLQKDALVLDGTKSFDVPAEGGEVKFAVAHNVALTATADVEWIVATKAMQNTEYSFTVAENTGAARSGKITVTNGTLKEEVTVNQAAWAPVFEVTPAEDQWLAVDGGVVTIEVNSNVEYTVTVGENDWITVANEGDVYTLTAGENTAYDYRSVAVTVAPKDEAYAESAVAFYIFQNGHASKLWTKNPAADLSGYDASQKVRLAKYGEYVLVANGAKVYALNAADGTLAATYDLPAAVQSLCTDDAGNILVATEASFGGVLSLYTVADPANPVPELLKEWDTANYYGTDVGNVRVKGNLKGNAVITATVSTGAGGAALMWEVKDGECSTWYWTSVPYAADLTAYACVAPAGTSFADGLFYIGYNGAANDLYYVANPMMDAASEWTNAYVTGSGWMENWNSISTAEWKGTKYAAILASCHFNYDDADAYLLNVNDPAAASLVYTYAGTYDVTRAEDWSNTNWTGAGTYSDILLMPTEDALLMVYIDSNYGAMSCVAIN